MFLGAELVNDNGISTVALGFFTALFGAISATVIGVFQLKAKANEARDAALLAKDQAQKSTETVQKVQENTAGIANGFSSRMDRKLDTVITNQNELAKAFREHLEWHLEKGQ